MLIATLKNNWLEASLILLLILVSGSTGYELGKQSALSDQAEPLNATLVQTSQTKEGNLNRELARLEASLASINSQAIGVISEPVINTNNLPVESHPNENQSIVFGSVNGTKYYNHGCKSGDRIKLENRIYFESTDIAQQAGYEPAKNCNF
jgi:hypothetical protein